MRNPIHDDEFEGYLQQQVKQHRLYPSDQIWRNIQESLHGNTKWPALAIVSITVIALLVTVTLIFTPNKQVIVPPASVVAATIKEEKLNIKVPTSQEVLSNHLSPEIITQHTIATVTAEIKDETVKNYIAVTPEATKVSEMHILLPLAFISTSDLKNITNNPEVTDQELLAAKTEEENTELAFISLNKLSNTTRLDFTAPVTLIPDLKLNEPEPWKATPLEEKRSLTSNLSSRFNYQFYVTPSISYRRLLDDKAGRLARNFIGVPVAANYSFDVNQIVRHRPALGVEVGFAAGYMLNKNLTVRTGLQFNIRQYDIDAYKYRTENAPVALVENNSVVDTLHVASRFRNYSGSTPVTISNTYYELSIPVGIDWKVFESNRIALHVASSIQPTYTFDKKPFIITTDYKNYADGSQLMRKWNLNSNIETYLSYRMGNVRWQIGPQFRYQQLPTFSNNYPIKEYLLDYGIKIGFTRSFK